MPAPVTVWAVELGPGSNLEEVAGALSLTRDALLFTPRDERRPPRRFALTEITRVQRLRGSPVLVLHRKGGVGLRTAFYFVQPPPLDRAETPTRISPVDMVRSSRRRARRQNVGYLGMWNREKKAVLREWERQLRTAMDAAG